jgi:osmotically-inducible protein OsmY
VSHPGALDVQAQDGTVVLSGNILRREVDDLISRVGKIRGVRHVESRLTVHDQPGDVPDLQ